MKATIEAPKERMVTLEMTESEAKKLKIFIGESSVLAMNHIDAYDTMHELHILLCDLA